MQQRYEHSFKKALTIKDVTAWVCVEDYLTNYAALEFLKRSSIKIPGQLGLVGFQDQIESLINDVTSYWQGNCLNSIITYNV